MSLDDRISFLVTEELRDLHEELHTVATRVQHLEEYLKNREGDKKPGDVADKPAAKPVRGRGTTS